MASNPSGQYSDEEEEDWLDTAWADPDHPPKGTFEPNQGMGNVKKTEIPPKPEAKDAGVVARMGLNDNKAGMKGLDREKINKIIMEASTGSKFYENERKKDEQVKRRMEEQIKKFEHITEKQLMEARAEADHLLQNLDSTRDLSHTIVHVDMDAFYAAVEMRDNPSLKDKPMAVGGNSMLSTSNYVARRYGVRAAMPGFIGKKLCPDLIIVPLNFEKYTAVSKEVRSILALYDPHYCPMSLDEAYLDLTEHIQKRQTMTEAERTVEICNELNNQEKSKPSLEQKDSSLDMEKSEGKTDRIQNSKDSENVNSDACAKKTIGSNRTSGSQSVKKQKPDLLGDFSSDEELDSIIRNVPCHLDVAGADKVVMNAPMRCEGQKTKEVFGLTVEEAVREMRFRIEQKTRLTASAGIAPNMMLAKICSDKNKPNGQYRIHPTREAVLEFIKDLPIRKVSGIGKVSESMLKGLGITMCHELYEKRAVLYHLYSPISFNYFMRICIGIGSTKVEREEGRKSMSVERTFNEINQPGELYKKCLELSEALSEDLQEEHLQGRTVSIKLKTVAFEVKTRTQSILEYTNDANTIYVTAKELLRLEIQACQPQPLRLRLLGVRVSNFSPSNQDLDTTKKKQSTIMDMFQKTKDGKKNEEIKPSPTKQCSDSAVTDHSKRTIRKGDPFNRSGQSGSGFFASRQTSLAADTEPVNKDAEPKRGCRTSTCEVTENPVHLDSCSDPKRSPKDLNHSSLEKSDELVSKCACDDPLVSEIESSAVASPLSVISSHCSGQTVPPKDIVGSSEINTFDKSVKCDSGDCSCDQKDFCDKTIVKSYISSVCLGEGSCLRDNASGMEKDSSGGLERDTSFSEIKDETSSKSEDGIHEETAPVAEGSDVAGAQADCCHAEVSFTSVKESPRKGVSGDSNIHVERSCQAGIDIDCDNTLFASPDKRTHCQVSEEGSCGSKRQKRNSLSASVSRTSLKTAERKVKTGPKYQEIMCPVCNESVVCADMSQFNIHLDNCLGGHSQVMKPVGRGKGIWGKKQSRRQSVAKMKGKKATQNPNDTLDRFMFRPDETTSEHLDSSLLCSVSPSKDFHDEDTPDQESNSVSNVLCGDACSNTIDSEELKPTYSLALVSESCILRDGTLSKKIEGSLPETCDRYQTQTAQVVPNVCQINTNVCHGENDEMCSKQGTIDSELGTGDKCCVDINSNTVDSKTAHESLNENVPFHHGEHSSLCTIGSKTDYPSTSLSLSPAPCSSTDQADLGDVAAASESVSDTVKKCKESKVPSSSELSKEQETPNSFVCPICNKTMRTKNLEFFNRHIDGCLSGQSKREQKPPKRKASSGRSVPSSQRKKIHLGQDSFYTLEDSWK